VDAALATAETLLKLSPRSSKAHDRLAHLLHELGNPGQALMILDAWCALHPHDVTPLLRRAVLHHELGEPLRGLEDIHHALALTSGPRRAEIAVLGARLVLRNGDADTATPDADRTEWLRGAAQLLEDGLRADPQSVPALWLLAAIRSLLGDQEGLARQAELMDRPEIADPRFHYAAAVCHLAARNADGVLEDCRRVHASQQSDKDLPVESAYLAGWAYTMQGETALASQVLRQPAENAGSPSTSHAQALLGKLAFASAEYDQAIAWLQKLDPKKRAGWKLNETLAGAVFLTALATLQQGRFEEAAEKIRQAGRLGYRDARLGPLLTLSLVKAGQRYLYNPLG
jgi:tetratricopeptide (TPR) repeat protein